VSPSAPGRPSKRHATALLDRYNSLVHGDPAAALHGAILMPDGSAGYTTGKDVAAARRRDLPRDEHVARGAACLVSAGLSRRAQRNAVTEAHRVRPVGQQVKSDRLGLDISKL